MHRHTCPLVSRYLGVSNRRGLSSTNITFVIEFLDLESSVTRKNTGFPVESSNYTRTNLGFFLLCFKFAVNGIPTGIPQMYLCASALKRAPINTRVLSVVVFGHIPGAFIGETHRFTLCSFSWPSTVCIAPFGHDIMPPSTLCGSAALKRALYCRSLLGCCFLSQAHTVSSSFSLPLFLSSCRVVYRAFPVD